MKQVILRLTNEQHADLKLKAEQNNQSVNRYAIASIFKPVTAKTNDELGTLTKEIRVSVPLPVHHQIDENAKYHGWSVRKEARAALCRAFSKGVYLYPKELKDLIKNRNAINVIGRNIRDGIRFGMIDPDSTATLLERLDEQVLFLKQLVAECKRRS
ncbi:MAG: hypothetical protein ACRCZ3_10180 [Providencia rustigianii]|uniref:hypothetical protein n=1 Tax=Providencia rustigianii TaxID=158850 RepID=UPI003F394E8F